MASVAQRGVCTRNVIYLNGTNAKWGEMKGIYWKYSRAPQSCGHYYESNPHKNNVLTCHNCFFYTVTQFKHKLSVNYWESRAFV